MSADVASAHVADITSSAPSRRKSGRVPTQRQLYSPTGSATKRKRGDANDSDADSSAPSSEEDDSDSIPDEEELKERRRQSRKKSAASAKKPPQKKPKTNGEITGLAIRPATSAKKKAARPRKAPLRKSALVEQDADGLYGEIRSCICT